MSTIDKLLHLVLTLPITSSSAERSFSTMKRIKSVSRSTMSNDRLDNLAIISVEKELSSSISIPKVVEKYAASADRRIQLKWK